jgi:hypothetical protein
MAATGRAGFVVGLCEGAGTAIAAKREAAIGSHKDGDKVLFFMILGDPVILIQARYYPPLKTGRML